MKYTFLLLSALILFSSCQNNTIKNDQFETTTYYQEEITIPQEKPVTLEMKQINDIITISLLNPYKKEIRSARIWLGFSQKDVTPSNIEIDTNNFDLIAPGENNINKEKALIQIGASSTTPHTETHITLASFQIDKHSKYPTNLQCYDYGEKTDSHCVVLDSTGKNLLAEPEHFSTK
ncbi:hypothetical protein COB57_04715 [Candidatus Peregrinibacteria bacterium]|nr:MAG: hypothetical protein COB57_04715 [Candidatus Peregrinibacteria bacterium]